MTVTAEMKIKIVGCGQIYPWLTYSVNSGMLRYRHSTANGIEPETLRFEVRLRYTNLIHFSFRYKKINYSSSIYSV